MRDQESKRNPVSFLLLGFSISYGMALPTKPEEKSINALPIIIGVVLIGVIIGGYFLLKKGGGGIGGFGGQEKGESQKPKVIEEKLVIPKTEKVVSTEAKVVSEGKVDVPLVPKTEGEKVIVPQAVLTVKGSYDAVILEAAKWSSDAQLSFIKSLGAVTLEGKSSQWQIVFASKTKKKGYEIIVQADEIVSKKEITSTAVGAELPKSWFDSSGAIKTLQGFPNFSDATVSAINFLYDLDSKGWMYAIATSKGATSISVQ